ncbi:hypothetical protein P7C71_g4613, partial [Lecanoromycetidae sp. Uapishka_2]
MDQDTARIGAQELDRESPKKEIPPTGNFEEKISDESSSHASQTSIDPEKGSGVEDKRDVEAANEEEVTLVPVKVPRAQRRGLFGRFALVAEVEEPKHYPRRTKWWITFVIALAAVAAPMGSAIIFHNIAMLIVMRILGGGAAASVQAVGAGTIADIWDVRERGKAMGIFYLGPLCGPLFAPIIGGALAEKLGWRSTQWFLAIYGGAVLIFLFFALPETLVARKSPLQDAEKDLTNNRPTLTRTTSRASEIHLKSKKYIRLTKRIFLDPLKIILYLRFPAVLITVYYASITFGSLYLLNISLETTFSAPPYNFSTTVVGLSYIPNSIGYVLASLFGGKWTDRIMAREARRANRYDENGKLMYRPEDRMRENAWIAAFLYPAALVWYGWTADRGVFWVAPLLANFFFGIGSMLIFAMATTMLTEFMPKRASNGVALNNFVRNIFSCVGAVVAQPLIGVIGDGWLFTGVGVIAAGSSVVVWAMRRYASVWRERMDRELN